ncbi:small subunit processome component 20 homolog isoform X1 [Watersipora subatra]|uniref:small subunit processome component 20 homolog isoform X1 n=1 Tax=Watersipora subatra TaxID=2589382 RepID=UPI00355B122C
MPEQYYEVAINRHLLPLLRLGIQVKQDTIRSEFLATLRDLINSRPDLYEDMVGLTNQTNVEDDFWENIRHIQVSRRLKGLNRLMRHLDTVPMKSSSLTKYLLPLVFSFIKDDTDYHKKNSMVDVCISTVGAICKHLSWSAYKSQLKLSLNLLSRLDNNKMAVRLLCTVLDAFHYDVSLSTYVEAQVGKELSVKKAEKRQVKASEEIVPKSERPTEAPISHQPVRLEANMEDDASDDVDEGIDVESETQESKRGDTPISATVRCSKDLATTIHSHIIGSILPLLHQIFNKKASTEDLHKENKTIHPDQAEVLRIPLAVAIVKLLEKISAETLERHLPNVLVKVCYFIKSRAEDIRDSARQTLAKMMANLGPSHMTTITEHLQATLTRGYQVNVLGYSLHYIIHQNIDMFKPGDLTPCLQSLVNITMSGLFGSSSQDKDVDKHDTSKEKRKPQYYEMFWLLAKFATAPTIAVILSPLKQKLDTIHKAKDMSKLRQCLERMADGLLQNPVLTAEQYLKFTYSLVSDSVGQFLNEKKTRQAELAEKKRKEKAALMHDAEETFVIPAEPGRAQPQAPTLKKSNTHVLVEFGMKLFHMLLKRAKISYGDEGHARMVDPFVRLLVDGLTSEDVPVIIESLICLTFVIKFKGLPSLVNGMEKIINPIFLLLKTYSGTASGESFELCQLCFRLISMVLKTCGYYEWTEEKVEILLSYAESDILDHNRQATAFSLLKAIISRKLICKLLYELIKKLEELSVNSESSDVRLNCRQVVLQFLLDYPLGKGLPKHINFYLDNLDYGAQHGRESIFEMLGAMLTAFPQKTVHTFSSSIFLSLAQARVNDEAEKCRRLAALGIKTLLGRVERNFRTRLFQMAFKWLQESKVEIVQMAAQVIGLFIEVECDGFSSRFNDFLPVLEKALQPQLYVTMEGESDSSKDLQLYHLVMLTMKVIRECPRVLRQHTCDLLLEHIKQLMLHPHAWVRCATAQVFGLVFSTFNPDELIAAFLSQESGSALSTAQGEKKGKGSSADLNKSYRSMMFLLRNMRQKLRDFTADFCTQLSSKYVDEEFAAQIVKNLIFLAKVILKLPESRSPTPPSPETESVDIPQQQPTEELVISSNLAEGASKETEIKKEDVSVNWLIRRLGKVATYEATNSPRTCVKRSNVFKCLAAIAMELGPHDLEKHLKNILPPIHRELTMVNLFPETEDLRNLAGEVCNLLKSTVGISVYSAEYANVHRAASQRKAERKRKFAQQAVIDPSVTARKKIRLHTKKHTSKRHAQNASKFKGNKFSHKSKKPIARDMAILQ